MKPDTINEIIKFAISSYANKHKPGEFAKKAAHKAALDAAREYNPDLADFATLNAAAEFYLEIALAVNFTSQIADKSVTMLYAFNDYQAIWEKYATTSMPKHIKDNYFQQLAQSSDKISKALTETIAPTFDTTSVLDVVSRNKAKRAALYAYQDTYTITRSAYIRAAFEAQNYNGLKQTHIFQKTITERLKKDLTYDIVNPWLFYTVLNSLIFKFFLGILLVLSISGLLLAIFNLTPIPFTPLISASSGAIVTSLGLTYGCFFATKKCIEISNANANRAENAVFI